MKQVFILRGLPGSGKSHYAQSLCDEMVNGDEGQFVICSTDDFFISDGQYRFDKAKLSEYHNLNLARFIRALSQQIPLVILDNTNIKKCHNLDFFNSTQNIVRVRGTFSLIDFCPLW